MGTSWALRACRSSAAVAEKKNSRATIYLFARDVMTSAHRAGGHSYLFQWRNTNWRVRTVCCKRYPLSSKATAIAADATSMEAVYAIIPVKCLRRRSQKKEKKTILECDVTREFPGSKTPSPCLAFRIENTPRNQSQQDVRQVMAGTALSTPLTHRVGVTFSFSFFLYFFFPLPFCTGTSLAREVSNSLPYFGHVPYFFFFLAACK